MRITVVHYVALTVIAANLMGGQTSAPLDSTAESGKSISAEFTSENAGFLTAPDSGVVPIDIRSMPQGSFLSRWGPIFAALIGSFFAGVIALYSVRRTNQNARAHEKSRRGREDQRKAGVYVGVLYSISVELQAHRMILRDIALTLPEVRRHSMDASKFMVEKIPHYLPMAFLNLSRSKIIEYDRFNTELLNEISAYCNSSSYLNDNLDFTSLMQFILNINLTPADALEAIGGAFDAVLDHLTRIVEARPALRLAIIEEIRRYPGNEIHVAKEADVEVKEFWEGKTLSI